VINGVIIFPRGGITELAAEYTYCRAIYCNLAMPTQQEYFKDLYDFVRTVPAGKVVSYSQAGLMAGYTAREVGRAMANCEDDDIPWHRVVGSDGYLRIGKRSPVHQALQRELLETEGVKFKTSNTVDMDSHQMRE
jgi:methylated-DNA-protein-cysteine methyltransferase-like protein